MLSEREKQFIVYWEIVRKKQNTVVSKLLNGLPMAILFFVPVVLFIFFVNIFLPNWYTKISAISTGSLITIMVAVFIGIILFSYFRMHYKWEENEQLYKELKSKEHKLKA